jgi:hypothetical protein
MAYDDDSTRFDPNDFMNFASLLELLASRRQQISLPQLAELVNEVHHLARGRSSDQVSVSDLSQALRSAGFSNVSIGLLDQIVKEAAAIPSDAEAADHITLAQARRLLDRG